MASMDVVVMMIAVVVALALVQEVHYLDFFQSIARIFAGIVVLEW